jgi:hypothetical protein
MNQIIRSVYRQKIFEFNKSLFVDKHFKFSDNTTPNDSFGSIIVDGDKNVRYAFLQSYLGVILVCRINLTFKEINGKLEIAPEVMLRNEHSALIKYINQFNSLFSLVFINKLKYFGRSSDVYLEVTLSENGYSYGIKLFYSTDTFKSVYLTGGSTILDIKMNNGIVDGSLLPVIQTAIKINHDIDIEDFNDYDHLKELNNLAEMINI